MLKKNKKTLLLIKYSFPTRVRSLSSRTNSSKNQTSYCTTYKIHYKPATLYQNTTFLQRTTGALKDFMSLDSKKNTNTTIPIRRSVVVCRGFDVVVYE